MKQINCFAYRENACVALKMTYCEKENCRFFKTQTQHKRDVAASLKWNIVIEKQKIIDANMKSEKKSEL